MIVKTASDLVVGDKVYHLGNIGTVTWVSIQHPPHASYVLDLYGNPEVVECWDFSTVFVEE